MGLGNAIEKPEVEEKVAEDDPEPDVEMPDDIEEDQLYGKETDVSIT